eukprot:3000901-Amphidinium_carterae.1
MALSASGLKEYFSLITVFALVTFLAHTAFLLEVVLAASALAFQEKPATPPSASELEKEQNPEGAQRVVLLTPFCSATTSLPSRNE